MVVLRSQDKRKLIVDSVVYKMECYYSFPKNNINLYRINVYSINDLVNEMELAEYSTEEKALKALDMLEKYFLNLDQKTYDNIPLQDKSFQFPEE